MGRTVLRTELRAESSGYIFRARAGAGARPVDQLAGWPGRQLLTGSQMMGRDGVGRHGVGRDGVGRDGSPSRPFAE
jgi:hypothetical protein